MDTTAKPAFLRGSRICPAPSRRSGAGPQGDGVSVRRPPVPRRRDPVPVRAPQTRSSSPAFCTTPSRTRRRRGRLSARSSESVSLSSSRSRASRTRRSRGSSARNTRSRPCAPRATSRRCRSSLPTSSTTSEHSRTASGAKRAAPSGRCSMRRRRISTGTTGRSRLRSSSAIPRALCSARSTMKRKHSSPTRDTRRLSSRESRSAPRTMRVRYLADPIRHWRPERSAHGARHGLGRRSRNPDARARRTCDDAAVRRVQVDRRVLRARGGTRVGGKSESDGSARSRRFASTATA